MADEATRVSAALADRYRVEREIGVGGMATVYLAQDLKHHRPVALKVLRPELAAVLGTERFLAEINVTAQPATSESAAAVRLGRGGRAAVLRDALRGRRVGARPARAREAASGG